MKILTKLGILIVMVAFVPCLVSAEPVIDDSKKVEYLFVLSASSGSLEGDILTLNGVPTVIYFSDRPARVAGHKSLDDFFGSVKNQSDDSGLYSSNAALSILKKGGSQYLVVELLNAELENDSISF